ncbi:hypothetical protein JW823_07880 [bacterium]|nr:hypothetical protein [candidate division CSSED10-310 bacterium]
MIKKSLITASIILAVTLTMGLSGCGDASGEANTKAPVILTITDLNANDPFQADVYNLKEDEVQCTVRVNPIDANPDTTSFYMDVLLKGYEISYYRKDTGSRVPETFTGNLSSVCSLNGTTTFPIIICRASQKEMPPLQDLCDPGYDQETGLFEIHTACRVVIWGDTFAGEEVVSKPAQMTVNFACQWLTE